MHASYKEMLDEDAKKEGRDKWYQPRCALSCRHNIQTLNHKSAMENPSTLGLTDFSFSLPHVAEFPVEECENASSGLVDVDIHSMR